MKKLHSLIATLLTFCIILSMFTGVFTVTAATKPEIWDGTTATAFAGGSGTSADPYLIENGAQLFKAINDLGKTNGSATYYLITNDIYLNEGYENYADWANNAPANNWLPTNGDFIGHLNGGYHTIYGLYSLTGAWRNGLIRRINSGATVTNVIVSKAYVRNNDAVAAGIVGAMYDNTKIERCMVYDAVISAAKTEAAGIVAKACKNTTTINHCGTYNVTLSATSIKGGILGKADQAISGSNGTRVQYCYSVDNFILGDTNKLWVTTSYTNISGSKGGVSIKEKSAMQGADALTNMSGLSASVWKVTDGYPTLIGNGAKGEVWSGNAAVCFAGGDGTSAHPYLIETPEQLYKAINEYGLKGSTAAYYLIVNDLYLNEDYENYLNWDTTAPKNNWLPSENEFKGHIDGGYHTIYGLYINRTNWYTGLIPNLARTGSVSNIIAAYSYVKSHSSANDSDAGVIVGYARGDTNSTHYAGTTIKNCIAHDCAVVADKYSAGIVGVLGKKTTIQNCGAYNLTLTGGTSVGGISGYLSSWGCIYKNCYSIGYKALAHYRSDYGMTITSVSTDNGDQVISGITTIENSKLKGAGAVATMGLSTSIWKDTDGYPTFAMNNGTEGETWTGAKANGFIGGTGTEEDPYLIATAEQLYKAICDLGKKSDGTAAYYLITADIYLNSDYENYADWANTAPANNWLPVNGDFIGHLDGGLNTVYGLYSLTGAWRNGLIRRMNTGATVTNLTVANAYVHNNDAAAAGIAGIMYDNTKISNCIVHDAVISAANTEAAGIVAKANKNTTTISNCGAYNLTLSAGKGTVGGILAKADQATSGANGTRIYNCYSAGNYPLGNNGNIWSDYNYSDIAGTKNGIALVESDAMKGAAAVNGMKYLDFITVWQTTENGYPVIREASDNNLSQEISACYSVENGNSAWTIFTAKVAMPKINPTYDDNIVITVDGVDKVVSEVGVIISRTGVDVTDIEAVTNNPLTGYKAVGYTNGGNNASVITGGGYVEINAIVNGTADYTAKSYIKFADDTIVMGDAYNAEPTTGEATVSTGFEVNDVYQNGDANFDGEVNLKDMVRVKKYAVLGKDFNANVVLDIVDTDGDSVFAASDFVGLRSIVLNSKKKINSSNYQLIFEDNFDTLTLDKSKWDFTNYMTGYGVNTVETSDVQSIKREEDGNGYLHLTSYKADDGSYKAVKSISTGNKLTFVHGYLEIRAKVPTVKGAWPSLWLKSNTGNANLGWSSNFKYNTEVDVFEVMGGNRAISELHKWQYVAETGATNDIRYSSKKKRNSYAITDNDWHTYGMLWTDDEITMYVDGVAIQTYNLNKDYEIKWPWDTGIGMDGFKNQPLCITLNNYLFTPEYAATDAGKWASSYVVGDDFTESVYDIDYVRLYQDETGILYKK